MALPYIFWIFWPEPANSEKERFDYFTTIMEYLAKILKHTGLLYSCQWKNVPLYKGNGIISIKRFHFLFYSILCGENYFALSTLSMKVMMHPKCYESTDPKNYIICDGLFLKPM